MAILRWLTLIVFKLIACMCTYICFYPHNRVPKHNEAYMCRKTSIDCISCSPFSDVLCNNDHLKLSVVRQNNTLDLIVPMWHDGSLNGSNRTRRVLFITDVFYLPTMDAQNEYPMQRPLRQVTTAHNLQ